MAIEAERQVGAARPATRTPRVDNLIHILTAARNLQVSASGAQARDETTYREFLDALGVAVYTTDAAGMITFYNEAAAEFWGRRPELGEEWCGSLRLYWRDGTPMRHDECPMAMTLRENRPVRGYEALAERPDGERVAFVPYPTPLRDETGKLVGAVNVLVDVTERFRAEESLRATADALVASNIVKDEFLGLVSHELRTPVTTIFGNAQILRDRGDAISRSDRDSMIGDIADDSERLLGIIENLLLLTRLGSGSKPEVEPQVLNHVVGRAIAGFSRRHPNRPVALSDDVGRLIVEADQTHIELLVTNLLTNAEKYSEPEAPIEVVLRGDGAEAKVVVLDRGMGLGEVDPARLFAPFYRAESARKRANGIGVGLAVCKRVAESQGGRIWARPRDGGGSEFGFALPITADHEAA